MNAISNSISWLTVLSVSLGLCSAVNAAQQGTADAPQRHVPIVQAPSPGSTTGVGVSLNDSTAEPASSGMLSPLTPIPTGADVTTHENETVYSDSMVTPVTAQYPDHPSQWNVPMNVIPSSPLPAQMSLPTTAIPPMYNQVSTPNMPPVMSGESASMLGGSIYDQGMMAAPAYPSSVVQGVVTGAVDSGCSTCGTAGCYDSNHVQARFGSSGTVSCASNYVYADAMYLTRNDDAINVSNFGGVGDFDGDLGWQLTLGQRFNSTAGNEFVYFGTTELASNQVNDSAAGNINASFAVGGGFSATETGSFFDATRQIQRLENQLHSVEFNQVRWRWDVFKAMYGFRGIFMQDDFSYASRNLGGTIGQYRLDTKNILFGPQIGGELFYDIGYRVSYSVMAKAGVGANYIDMDTILDNDGTRYLNKSSDTVEFSGWFDLGLVAHYQISTQARFRAGFQMLYLWDVATTQSNFPTVMRPTTGNSIRDNDDVFYGGVFAGLEIFR